MYYITEAACVIAEVWLIHMFLSVSGNRRGLPFWQFALIYGLFGVIVTVLSFVEDASFLRLGFCLLGIWSISVSLFGQCILRGLLSGFLFCVFVALTDVAATLVMVAVGVAPELVISYGIARSVYLIFDHIVLFALVMLVCLFYRKGAGAISMKILIPVLPCWLVTILLCCLLGWQVLVLGETVHRAYIGVLLGLLYTNMVMIYYMNRMNAQAKQQKEMELVEHHYAMQQEYYEQFRIQQEETRAIWHDISKMLRAIEVDGSNQSLEQLQQMLSDVSCVVDVNNRVVSVILNEYVQASKTAGVKLEIDVQVPRELFVTASDLYVLLGNTLDNALEACAHLPVDQRKIELKLKLHNSILFYEITNPCGEYPCKTPGRFHGYGLKNVRRCVERYHGNLEITADILTFKVTAHLNSI